VKSHTLVRICERLESIAARLPGALREPILREVTPLKEMFLLARAPRFLVVGSPGLSDAAIFAALFGDEVPFSLEGGGQWRGITHKTRGGLRWLDGRLPVPVEVVKGSLAEEIPDMVLVAGSGTTESGDLDRACELVAFLNERHDVRPPILGISDGPPGDLNGALHARPELSVSLKATLPLIPGAALAARVIELLPGEAKLDMARLSRSVEAQEAIAKTLVKSVSAMCGAIGAQPIPLADFPILTALQAAMVSGIVHISGREWNPKLVAEFLGAIGANVGVGLVCRETARAAAKLVPGWGNAISGGVAGVGTYTVGRAAISYFVHGHELPGKAQRKSFGRRFLRRRGE